MAAAIPYTYIQCPCTRDTHHDGDRGERQDDEDSVDSAEERAEEDDDFDPHSPRANYSLYPIEHLLYCEICAQIRCQRCLVDEIVTWFCPNCLFEVPSSTVKTEGNRCTRSCFQCPICIAPLSLTGQAASNTLLGGVDSSHWVLSCASCSWSSSEIGIQFDRPNGIYSQLSRIRNGGAVITPPKERALGKDIDRRPGERRSTLSKVTEHDTPEPDADEGEDTDPTPETRFANLRAFYQGQMSSHGSAERSAFTNDYSYASPNALSRIMNLYTSYSSPTPQKRTPQIREALSPSEGLRPIPDPAAEAATILRLREEGWVGTPSTDQRAAQPFPTCDIHSTSELRPSPYLLRTKRTKRCRTCKHIVVRPEAKVQTSRFRMKMLAASYIPTLSIRPLPSPASAAAAAAGGGGQLLQPGATHQFVLTVRNPLYERVRVTLAAAAKTPGRVAHGVTLLCPQFEVGASREAYADMLDEALGGGDSKAGSGEGEAGKVYERARNSVGVVVEVVPGVEDLFRDARSEVGDDEEEEEALEIPVRVRVEWEAEGGEEKDGGEGAKVKRELGFWVVLGVGKVRRE
ncbi:hypothetical protein VE03_09034 [Pseudogymnoascus sp. 23342-1-I1]|nr:hypothetical protein VE03_09034 [Pseudogymnoascus sp. 23342-1-I1]